VSRFTRAAAQGAGGRADGRIRVVHVVKGLGPGGAERLILNQLRSGDHAAVDYRVLRLIEAKSHLVPEIEALGVPVGLVGSGLTWPLQLRKMLRAEDPDVVHVHSPVIASLVRVVNRVSGRRFRVVTTEHNRWPRHHPLTRLANRCTVGLDDATIAVSDDVRSSMSPRAQRTTRSLRHGIPITEIRSELSERAAVRAELGLDGVVVGIVANFRPEKAYDVFLAAAGIAAARNDDLHFVVIGQGPGEADFRRAVAASEHADRISVLGYRPDARRVMTGFDVFTLSSRHEGLPVSLMEAFALGLPVVATRAGGIPEAVSDGVEGVLVDIDDAPALAAGWLRLAEDAEVRSEMAQAASMAASSFDAASSTSEIESAYRRLMTGSG
jgi:glycosyltransferase involved in cell wall biosynthesis